MKKVIIVYILGYGRSGSTLLDVILGNHREIFGAGEIWRLFSEYKAAGKCSCGEILSKCHFWNDVLRISGLNSSQLLRADEINSQVTGLRGLFSSKRRSYADVWDKIFESVCKVSGKRFVIDSSKSDRFLQGRFLALQKYTESEIKAIHIVRDPRAVLNSVKSGSNRMKEIGHCWRPRFAAIRSQLGWNYANLVAESLKLLCSNLQCMTIRYEDLVSDPEPCLTKIGQFLDVGMEELIKKVTMRKPLKVNHGIAGNRMRRSGSVKIKQSSIHGQGLSKKDTLISSLSLPLRLYYGYL
jgi:hypothetical protein